MDEVLSKSAISSSQDHNTDIGQKHVYTVLQQVTKGEPRRLSQNESAGQIRGDSLDWKPNLSIVVNCSNLHAELSFLALTNNLIQLCWFQSNRCAEVETAGAWYFTRIDLHIKSTYVIMCIQNISALILW
ncbi:hypothetical protein DPMN_152884 [Dreissena polymorpha]|uniref:Uncharacterized protein n=1 Tax=Dreissena polymorpha TaxID=45954 RepID=A0A9D4J8D0_DREPO|nr:hypothetical protein DPMN_152884 [Dreissena polymorpha]